MKIDEGTMARYVGLSETFIVLLVVAHLEQLVLHNRAPVVEAVIEDRFENRFEKCCGLGTSWAAEGLRCEKFIGPVPGVPTVEQGPCQKAVDICCVRKYHDLQCEKGKADARQGLPCLSNVTSARRTKITSRSDYHRDCCEGCKLGIYAASTGQGCSFKSFSFGIPWDPAFLECCHENLPSTTTDLTSPSTMNTEFSSSPSSQYSSSPSSPYSSSSSSQYSSSPSSPYSSSSSSQYSSSPSSQHSSSASSPYSSSPSSPISSALSSSQTSPSSSSSDRSSSSSTSSSESTPYSIPTPELDDICQLMKGILCSDICVPTPGSYYCKCRDGFTLLEDGKTCSQDPTDRCKATHPCEQICTDNGEAVICSCNPGYDLADDGRSCNPKTTKNKKSTDADKESLPSPRCPPGYRYNANNQVCDDIDECSVLSNACTDAKPFCVNTPGSYACLEMTGVKSCPAGFKYDKSLQQCKDVDECAEAIHSCLEDVEECRNTDGAYECDMKCEKGFTYSISMGICVDINECAESSNLCPEPGTLCVNTLGAYECVMSSGDPLPRLPAEKDLSDRQRNVSPSSLTCIAGYKPANNSDITCVDVDECSEQLHSCEPDELCVNEIGSYRCVPAEHDEGVPTVKKSDDGRRDDRYSRNHKLGETSTFPITNNNNDNKMEDCGNGYFLDGKSRRCIDVDECANGFATCGVGERCVNTEGSYRCSPTCLPGFRLRPNLVNDTEEPCEDINECSLGLHNCNRLTHRCLNTNGSYLCELLTTTTTTTTTTSTTTTTTTRRPYHDSRYKTQSSRGHNVLNNKADRYWSTEPCRLGYKREVSTGFCVDIDECLVGPGCRDYEKCANAPGGYDCSPLCGTGWFFNTATKSCQDVDECLLGRHDCSQGTHRCVNTNGSFVCELIPPCKRGFRRTFNGTCLDIDECSESLHTCRLDLHQYCVNREGSFECLTRLPSCQSGYQYSLDTRQCEDIDECSIGQYNCDARHLERCVNLPGTYRCERLSPAVQRPRQRPACPSGYRYNVHFRACADIDECAEGLDTCGAEICYNQPGGYSCATPPAPITRKPSTTAALPVNNQKCIDGTRYVRNRGCVDINECRELEDACSSNEECVNTMGSYTCTCKTGFRRDNLTQACVDINECQLQQNDCLPTQRCDNTIGSYTCTRFLPCGTGYTLNAATEICEDDDECVLGTDDCSAGYQCRNTLGSYRCDRIPRIPVPQPRTLPFSRATMTTTTTTTTATPLTPAGSRPSCPPGFETGSGGKCVDIDECRRTPSLCGRQNCINTLGSFRCVSRVICPPGYALDPVSGQHCLDIDECREGTHECVKGQICENRPGGYHCLCPPGYVDGPNNDCVDIDECSVYGSRICGLNSRCENTAGSFRCLCDEGFENSRGTGPCQDIDECERIPGLCQHVCLNVWGSYRCGCNGGFRLNADNRSCSDVDECTEFKDNNLCIGICDNTPGSYACKCPDGYRLGTDGRTCQDINECAAGKVCRDSDETCHNTRGSYRCNRINCPAGYHRDPMKKNRCVRAVKSCPWGDLACIRLPLHYSYNFITFVSMFPIPNTGQLELFTMRSNHHPDSSIQFTMALMDVRAAPGVMRATESCFSLRKPSHSQAVLVLTRSIPGPQDIELDLSMEIYHDNKFVGSAVAKIIIFVSQYEF
ncbi:PREDICTED: fibrillin-1-like [Dinoponera quadriceps]|uniref:Fibrillin-1-like n=1 Tax=Dinoponera quadriceps TaxID=609295 RepID=A0A6P3YCI7_DINQU|nr:PREDICTED: fibrillin-1-like [Dinoponera quadriceps]